MWVIKGVSVGLVIFLIGAVVYVTSKLRPIEAGKATSIDALLYLTAWNVWFWIALLICLAVGCYLFRPHVVS